MTILVLTLTVAIFAISGLVIRGHAAASYCPACRAELQLISGASDGPHRSYDIMSCPACLTPQTRVHGATSRYGYCPACKNRSLSLSCTHEGVEPEAIEVHESCELCSYEHTFEIAPSVTPPQCQIIPFPDPSRRHASK
jgi:uncharacterized protein YbaR (Trm112 family)